MHAHSIGPAIEHPVRVTAGAVELEGTLAIPQSAAGVVVFAHGSGSGRHSPRNRFVARVLREAGLGTVLLDLLTADEEAVDVRTAEFRFDIGLLAERVVGATDWLAGVEATAALPVGYFGASTGAGAALVAAARRRGRGTRRGWVATPVRTADDLDPLLGRIGDARFVLLGEASHGTHEYYTWRAEISKRLITEKGFSFIAVEGDWPDCYRVNRYVKGYPDAGDSATEVLHAFDRWPTWMWANEEVADLAEWLRRHNDGRPEAERAGFYGLDV